MSFDFSFYLYSALTSYMLAFLFSMFLDLHTLKTSENHSFPDVFMGGGGGWGVWNGNNGKRSIKLKIILFNLFSKWVVWLLRLCFCTAKCFSLIMLCRNLINFPIAMMSKGFLPNLASIAGRRWAGWLDSLLDPNYLFGSALWSGGDLATNLQIDKNATV